MKQQRIIKLLTYLLEQSEEKYTTSKSLSELVGVSTKTVLKDLSSEEMRKFLSGGTIERKEHVGIRLSADEAQRKRISNKLYDHLGSEDIRLPSSAAESEDFEKVCIALLQTRKGLSKEKISRIIFRDTSVLENLLLKIGNYVESYSLKIEWHRSSGYALTGDEADIRELYRVIVLRKITIEKPDQLAFEESGINLPIRKRLELIFETGVIDTAIDLADKAEINLNERFTNYDYEILITKICIMISRMNLDKHIESQKCFDMSVREHLVAHLMVFQLDEVFHFGYNSHEHNELTELLLSTRRINQKMGKEEQLLDQETLEEFIRLVGSSLGVELNSDKELKTNLFNHLLPAVRRVSYGIQIENPLLKQIQLQHTDVYVSVLTGIEIIEKAEQVSFNEDEIGFVCLHIVAAMNRSSKKGYIKIVFVCDEGQAVMTFLASKIEKQFPEIQITDCLSSDKLPNHLADADAIFDATASVIQYENIPTIKIHDLIKDDSMSVIRNWILNREYEKLSSQKSTLRDSFLYYRDRVTTKEGLIRKYADLLLKLGYVTKEFGKSAIQREKTIPTALGRGIALPHGSSDFVKLSCILIIKLEEPIDWSGNRVDLVFLTAINQADVDIHRSFFEQLFKIISNENLLKEIKTIDEVDSLKQLLFPEDE